MMVMNDRRQATTRLVGRDAVVVKRRGRWTGASVAPARARAVKTVTVDEDGAVGLLRDVGSSRASVDDGDVGSLVASVVVEVGRHGTTTVASGPAPVGDDGDVGLLRAVAEEVGHCGGPTTVDDRAVEDGRAVSSAKVA
jgi:hypothetical protein